ncbi:s68306 pol retrotransposon woot, partial [Lasius niger]
MIDRHANEYYASEDEEANEEASYDDEDVARDDETAIELEVDADIELNIIRTQEIIRDVDEVTAEDSKRAIGVTRPYATVSFGNLRVNCLIDTGAQISAVRKSFYDKLVEKKIDLRVIPIRKFTLVGAFAEKGELIANKLFAKFALNGREFSHGLYVVKNLAYDMVLGLDYLSRNRAILRCKDNDFTVDFDEGSKDGGVAMNAIAIEDANARLERLL